MIAPDVLVQINAVISQTSSLQSILKSEEGTASEDRLLDQTAVDKINTNIGLLMDYLTILIPINAA